MTCPIRGSPDQSSAFHPQQTVRFRPIADIRALFVLRPYEPVRNLLPHFKSGPSAYEHSRRPRRAPKVPACTAQVILEVRIFRSRSAIDCPFLLSSE
jgi:hypothetical protein